MAITLADFNKIWASKSPLTPYSFSDSQYKEGWNFIGGTPPSRQMWDFLQKNNDEKMQYLLNNFDNYLPLSGGNITGDLSVSGAIHFNGANNRSFGFDLTDNNANMDIGWNWENRDGAGFVLRSIDVTVNTPGSFSIYARDSTNTCTLNGTPDGTLTWNSQPLLPVGIVQAFAGTKIPNGWLLCDGSAVSRTDYAALFAGIGTTYGAGDGSTTFNLPNLVDKFVEGSATAGTVKSAGLPNITGSVSAAGAVAWQDPKGAMYFSGGLSANPNGYSGSNQVTLEFSASRSNSIYGNSTTVQPPALTMRYIIKY